MKIKDVLIKEYQMGNIGQPNRTSQAAAAPKGQATQPAAPAVFKPADTSFSSNYSQRNRAGFVPNVATSTPGSGQAAQPKPTYDPNNPQKKAPPKKAPPKKAPPKKAPNQPVDAMAGSDAGDQQTSNYTGQAQTSTPAPTGQAAPNAELDRLKQLAIGGEQPAPAPEAPYGGAAANAMAAKSAPTPAPQTNALGVQSQSGGAFGQPAPQADNPNPPAAASAPAPAPAPEPAQAAQPAPMKTAQDFTGQPQISPDTGLSTAPKPVMSAGGKTNVTTGSDDELAWRSKQTGIVDVTKYPGPGNWDPKTGRSKKDIEQGQKNLQGIKNFFGFGDKKAPAEPAPGPQNAQPVNLPPGFAESVRELDRIKKLSGLR